MTERRYGSAYKVELRANRRLHVKAALGAKFADAGMHEIEDAFLRDLVNLQNRTRGQLFEVIGAGLVRDHIRRSVLALGGTDSDMDICTEHQRFATPDGLRVVDLFYPTVGLVAEVKSGYVCANRDIRSQIAKDQALLKAAGAVGHAVWVLFRGASKTVLRSLDVAGIEWVDLEWDIESAPEP